MNILTTSRKFSETAEAVSARCKELDASRENSWVLWNDGGEYIDLELERRVDYKGEESDLTDYYSLNLHVTFDTEEKEFYFVLGDNRGDGFNDHVSCPSKDEELATSEEFIDFVVCCNPNSPMGFRKSVAGNRETLSEMLEEANEMLDTLNLTWTKES
ncbi:hypothetical protein [Neptuniibacter sp. QD37_11]|uniref:hypothetical protein n=1 Tax=Neptuniibacter sp. QD37_11 TaxID=3398209 RepID=UPI0039F57B31